MLLRSLNMFSNRLSNSASSKANGNLSISDSVLTSMGPATAEPIMSSGPCPWPYHMLNVFKSRSPSMRLQVQMTETKSELLLFKNVSTSLCSIALGSDRSGKGNLIVFSSIPKSAEVKF